MTTLETTALVADDRRMVLQVPDDVSPGEHRVRVEIDPVTNGDHEVAPTEQSLLRRRGHVLVYDGEMTDDFDIRRLIEQDRDDRMRMILGDFDPSEADV